MFSTLQQQIAAYLPTCEQEETDRAVLLHAIATLPNLLTRDNQMAHFTASGWIVNATRDKVLMAYHNIYKSWTWTGGHADGEADLLAVACREACEETGLTCVKPLSSDIFSLETLCVTGHRKHGIYVAPHLHLNLTYLLCADEFAPIFCKPDENAAVRWYPLAEAVAVCSEAYMQIIFNKLNDKLSQF